MKEEARSAEQGLQLLQKAQQFQREGNFADAIMLYDQLLTQNPKHADLLGEIATVHLRNPHTYGHAIMMFERCIELFKEEGRKVPFEVVSNMSLAYKNAGLRSKAEKLMKKLAEDEPNATTLSNYGSLYVETDEVHKGRDILERAVKMKDAPPMAHWNLSLCLLSLANESKDWGRAWDEYEYGQIEGGMRIRKKHVPLPDWDGTKGKKLIAYGEQGIGDEIMFASMLPDLMRDSKEVILDCHPRLTTLFEKNFGVKCYGTRKKPELDWLEQEKPEAMIAMGSLGKFYRRTPESFPRTPYLKAEPLLPPGRKLRVGVSWTGGRLAQRVARRTVPLSWWHPILANDVEVVSLQYTDGAADEIKFFEDRYKIEVKDYSQITNQRFTEDYYETARLVASCDLVITVCTSIVHLAGAMGIPTWVMVPRSPAWRYGHSGPMPFYGTVRLYRQQENKEGAWIPVIQKIAEDMTALCVANERKAA